MVAVITPLPLLSGVTVTASPEIWVIIASTVWTALVEAVFGIPGFIAGSEQAAPRKKRTQKTRRKRRYHPAFIIRSGRIQNPMEHALLFKRPIGEKVPGRDERSANCSVCLLPAASLLAVNINIILDCY
jgi:hypothetical protein